MSRILFFLGIFIVIAVAWSISRRRSELTIKERDELEELRRTQKAHARCGGRADGALRTLRDVFS